MKPPFYPSISSFLFGRIAALSFLLTLFLFHHTQAQNFPPNFSGVQIATGLDPVALDIAPDGRIFITEKSGRIRIVKNGTLLPTPFVTVADVDNYNERGLMGIALDPNFALNQYVYVYYTHRSGNNNRVSRFTANGDVAAGGSEQVILNIDRLSPAGVHNGGGLFFKDGKLFVLTGDNADGENSQSLSTLKGKVLRINPDGSIPADNPFYNSLSGDLRAIWALGFRNPFKGAAQPGTGRVFVNDVGQNGYEEVNEVMPGKNYGWPAIEGPRTSQAAPNNYQDPFLPLPHGQDCAVTGGAFYNPSTVQFPAEYVGKYFIGDYCTGRIRAVDPVTGAITVFATGVQQPLDTKVANDGSFYFIARGGREGGSVEANTSSNNGVLWKVTYGGGGAPTIGVQPGDRTSAVGGSVTFSVNASGNPAPSFQWQRNGADIPGANSASYTVSNVSLGDNGARFRVVVSNSAGSVTSNEGTLSVNTNQRPTASITTPSAGARYSGGDVIQFAGSGTDPEDGNLPAGAFTWSVDLYHFDVPAHTHPAMAPISGVTSGSFTIPTSGETSQNVLYRIYLTVRDSQGSTHTQSFDVNPNKARVTLATSPSGLDLKLDGSTVKAPYQFTGVSKIDRNLEAFEGLTLGSSTFSFHSWSDGGARSHVLSTPSSDQTITAHYIRSANNPANLTAGLEFAYYEGNFNQLPNFGSLNPVRTGKIADFNLSAANRPEQYALRFRGYIEVPADGRYTFYTNSDDGSNLYIGDLLIVNNDGTHGAQEASGSLYLRAGKHPIEVAYFENTGGEFLTVSYEGPGIGKQIIPASVLSGGGSGTVPTNDTQAPSVPGGLSASAITQTGLTLSWTASVDNVGVTVYEVFRGNDKIGETASTSFNVSGLNAGTAYTFTVRAKDAAGNTSSASPVLNTSTQAGSTTPTPTNPPPPSGCPSTRYLSDLSPANANNGWGPFERDRSNNEHASGDGNTIRLNGQNYAKGLGVHAASEITYSLGGNWTRFRADIGIDDEVSSGTASVVFEVWADGQRLFQSGTHRHNSPVQSVDVDVTGKNELKLIVTGAGDGVDYDHADWADARLEKLCPGTPPTSGGSIYEAENAFLSGVHISTLHPDYTGTAFADYINPSGDYIEWTITVPAAGSYVLAFRYGLGDPNGRPLEVKVNGNVVAASLAFPSTVSWTNWQYAQVTANLPAGTSTVRTTAIGSSGANIDHLRVTARSGGRVAATQTEPEGGEVRVYPNPATDYVQLVGLVVDPSVQEVEMLNLAGQVVARPRMEEGGRVQVRQLPTGMYLLRVQSTQGLRQFKVMKR